MAEDNERLSDTNPAEKLRPGDPDPSAPRDAEADGSLAAPGRPTRRSPTWRTAPRGSAPRPAVCEAGGFVRWYRGLFSDLGAFTREQAVPLALSALVVAATYVHLLFTNNIGIDTETMVNIPGTILNWYGIGREGMVLSKFVLGTLDFNMYWAEYLGLAFLLLAVWMWCFLLHRLGARRRLTFCVFPMVFATHPIFVEQFYFTTQMAEFNFALLMVPVAFLLIVEGARSRSADALGVAGAAGCLLFLWAFASYQSFLALVLATGALTGLMMARQDPFDRAAFKRCAWCFALAFIASAAAYLVITRTWFSSSDYLTGQILWGTQSVALCLRSLGRAVRDMAFGEGRFYTPVYIVAAVLLVCRLAVDFGRGAGAGRRGFIVLASALLLVCPFLLPAVMATAPAARTAFTLPFVSASALVLLWEGSDSTAPGLAVKRLAMAVLVLAVTGSQMATSLRLIYTDDVAQQQSLELAGVLCHDLDVALEGSSTKAVVFVGCWEPELNSACLRGEYIGTTEFHWGDASLPHYQRSSEIVCNWLESQGHTYAHPTDAQVIEARKIAYTMAPYTKGGGIYDAGSFVVVKLGPDLFYNQDIAPLAASGQPASPGTDEALSATL